MTGWLTNLDHTKRYWYIGLFDGEALPTKFWVSKGYLYLDWLYLSALLLSLLERMNDQSCVLRKVIRYKAASVDIEFMSDTSKPHAMDFNSAAGFVCLICKLVLLNVDVEDVTTCAFVDNL